MSDIDQASYDDNTLYEDDEYGSTHCCNCNCSCVKRDSCVDWFLPRSNVDLPFMRERAEAMGATLPLPFGVSGVFTELNRSVAVSDLRVGIGDNPPESVERFKVGDLDAHASTQLARADVWLFPFLNVYGVCGRTRSSGEIIATIYDFPTPGSPEVSFPIDINLDGVTYGGGGTLALGTPKYFGTLDMKLHVDGFHSAGFRD